MNQEILWNLGVCCGFLFMNSIYSQSRRPQKSSPPCLGKIANIKAVLKYSFSPNKFRGEYLPKEAPGPKKAATIGKQPKHPQIWVFGLELGTRTSKMPHDSLLKKEEFWEPNGAKPKEKRFPARNF